MSELMFAEYLRPLFIIVLIELVAMLAGGILNLVWREIQARKEGSRVIWK